MSVARQTMAAGVVNYLGAGAICTLRRKYRLRNELTGDAPTDLRVKTAAGAGASSLTLTATGLSGNLLAGVRLQVAGDPTEYSIGADVDVDEVTHEVTVSISPVLDQAADVDDAVTLLDAHVDATYQQLEDQFDETEVRDLVTGTMERLMLARGLGERQPQEDDIQVDGSDRRKVVRVRSPAEAYWLVLTEAA